MTTGKKQNKQLSVKRALLLCLALCLFLLASCGSEEPHLSIIKKEYIREAQLITKDETFVICDKEFTDALYHLLTTVHAKVGESYYPEPRWWVDEWDEIVLAGWQDGIGNVYSQMYIFCQDGKYYIEQQYSGLFEITSEQYDAAISILHGKTYRQPLATYDGQAAENGTEEEIQG